MNFTNYGSASSGWKRSWRGRTRIFVARLLLRAVVVSGRWGERLAFRIAPELREPPE